MIRICTVEPGGVEHSRQTRIYTVGPGGVEHSRQTERRPQIRKPKEKYDGVEKHLMFHSATHDGRRAGGRGHDGCRLDPDREDKVNFSHRVDGTFRKWMFHSHCRPLLREE